MAVLHVRAVVRPTEDEEKVAEAARRFLGPEASTQHLDGAVEASTTELEPLRRRIWEQRIIDTFRGQLLHGMADEGLATTFRLSKQAAYHGKLSFPPSPHGLGDLDVALRLEDGDGWRDVEQLIWWLCPETRDGQIVGDVA
ncbi:MAG: RNA-binding domain-containing protein [Thermoplasmatota archaeon]